MARSGVVIAQPQMHDFNRILRRNMHRQFVAQASAAAYIATVALAVMHSHGRLMSEWQRRRSPDVAALLVPQVDDLAWRIRNGVVRPRRQPVHLAVAPPGVAEPGLSRQAAEVRVCQDIAPRCRRQGRGSRLDAVHHDDIFASPGGEPPESVPVQQVFSRCGRTRLRGALRPFERPEYVREVMRRGIAGRAGLRETCRHPARRSALRP